MTDKQLEQSYDNSLKRFSEELTSFIMREWGERCPDYEPGCLCCEKWKAYDELMKNPYGGEGEQ